MARSARIHASAASALVETPPTYDKGKPGATRGRKATGLAANATGEDLARCVDVGIHVGKVAEGQCTIAGAIAVIRDPPRHV